MGAWISEFREVVWLASVVSGLSVLGVGMANIKWGIPNTPDTAS